MWGEYIVGQFASFPDANEREIYRTLSCGEDLVHAYADEEMQTTVLRLPAIFSGSDASYGVGSVCRRMAEQYLWQHELHYVPNERHREIYYPDAAEAVRRIADLQEFSPLYQVAGIAFSEQEFADALKSTGIVEERNLRLRAEEAGGYLETGGGHDP